MKIDVSADFKVTVQKKPELSRAQIAQRVRRGTMDAVHVKGQVNRRQNICDVCGIDMKTNPKQHRETKLHKKNVAR